MMCMSSRYMYKLIRCMCLSADLCSIYCWNVFLQFEVMWVCHYDMIGCLCTYLKGNSNAIMEVCCDGWSCDCSNYLHACLHLPTSATINNPGISSNITVKSVVILPSTVGVFIWTDVHSRQLYWVNVVKWQLTSLEFDKLNLIELRIWLLRHIL